jgi:hypothetical protein
MVMLRDREIRIMITVLGSAEVKGAGLRRESREGWGTDCSTFGEGANTRREHVERSPYVFVGC